MLSAGMEVEGLDPLPNEASKNLSPGILLGPSWWWDGGERIARCLICPLYPRGRERASAPVLCITASSSQPAFPSELQDKLRD